MKDNEIMTTNEGIMLGWLNQARRERDELLECLKGLLRSHDSLRSVLADKIGSYAASASISPEASTARALIAKIEDANQ